MIVLSSVVSVLLLIFIPISLYSQNKIFDFETVSYLSVPNFFIVDSNSIFGINYSLFKNPDGNDCVFKFVRYNLEDGSVNEELDSDISQGNDCYRPKLMYKNGNDLITISELSNVNSAVNDKISLTIHSDYKSKTYFEKNIPPTKRILNDIVRPFIDNSFYKLDYITPNTNGYFLTYNLYKYKIDNQELEKELVNNQIVNSQLTFNILAFDNENYFTTINIFNKVISYDEVVDTMSKFVIYRFNKLNYSMDTLLIDNEFTYFFPKTFEKDNKIYIAVSKQDSSTKNIYLLDNKLTIFCYDIELNILEKVKDLEFKNKVLVNDIHYDEYSNHLYFYGSSFDSSKSIADGTYSDYWISELDEEFDLLNELNWKETNIERLNETVYNLKSENESLILVLQELDIINSNNSKSTFIKIEKELISNIHKLDSTFKFLIYPNPTSSFINIKTLGLPYKLELYDYSGRKVIEKIGIFEIDYNLDVSELPQGLYTLKVDNKGIIQSKNLIIKK